MCCGGGLCVVPVLLIFTTPNWIDQVELCNKESIHGINNGSRYLLVDTNIKIHLCTFVVIKYSDRHLSYKSGPLVLTTGSMIYFSN